MKPPKPANDKRAESDVSKALGRFRPLSPSQQESAVADGFIPPHGGYQRLLSFQRAEVMVAPALMSEGKKLQNEQSVGMGSNGKAAVSNGVAVSDD
jgi:hypothetical protein